VVPARLRGFERALLGLLGTTALAACSALASLDGLTGGGADAGVPEASPFHPDTSVAPPADAGGTGGDGAPLDASPTSDAATDAGTSDGATTDAPAGPFCATLTPAPLFCDDFDEAGLGSPPWDQVTSSGATATLSATDSISPPRSMLVTTAADAGNLDCAGYKSFAAQAGVAATYVLAFDLKIDAADPSTNADTILAALQVFKGNATWDLQLELSHNDATTLDVDLSENASTTGYTSHPTGATITIGAWTHVEMDLEWTAPDGGAGGASTASLKLGGAAVASEVVHVTTSNGTPEILVGTTYVPKLSASWRVRYDNVTFAAK
jgi:hypothetical protein